MSTAIILPGLALTPHLKELSGMKKDLSRRYSHKSSNWLNAIFNRYCLLLNEIHFKQTQAGEEALQSGLADIELDFLKFKFAQSTFEKDRWINTIKEKFEMHIDHVIDISKNNLES